MPARYEQLAEMILLNEWKRGAVIGLFDGMVFLHLLNRCPLTTIVGVETWDLMTIDDSCNCAYCESARFNMRKRDRNQHKSFVFGQAMKLGNAEILNMPSEAAAKHTFKYSLDFVFIERSNNVSLDIHMWLESLRPGGHMLGHKNIDGAGTVFEGVLTTGDDHMWWVKL